MRKKIVAGNWKMNNDLAETETLISELSAFKFKEGVEVIIAPAFTNLWPAFEATRELDIEVVAQNMHQEDKGAFTGEISASMLKSIGIRRVILGHSERRSYFNETNSLLADKVSTAIEAGLQVIFCFGERLEDRKSGNHFELVKQQLTEGIFHISETDWEDVVLAYEPVWAIGTGETATPQQAQEMHAFIRKTIKEAFNDTIANQVSILYGGSVKPDNAKTIFDQLDVDGGLIGGAALKAQYFAAIINAF